MSTRARASRWRGALSAALAVTLVGLSLPAAAEPPTLTGPGPPRVTPGTLTVTSPVGSSGSVFLRWEGTIAAPMATQIQAAFDAFKANRRRFVLVLNTGGGSVAEGERVIAILQQMRKSHQVDTAVERGARCGSMCVPVYLQGETRFGARASAWLFHEVTRPGSGYGRNKKVEGSYMRLIEKYWVPAGVSRPWIDRMLPLATDYDYWQTGENLIVDKAGIITRPIENRSRRALEGDDQMPAQPRTARRPGARGPAAPLPSDPGPTTEIPPVPGSRGPGIGALPSLPSQPPTGDSRPMPISRRSGSIGDFHGNDGKRVLVEQAPVQTK